MSLLTQIKTQEKVDFVKNLSLLIKSGKPINESFDLLAKQTANFYLGKFLEAAKKEIEKGAPIYEQFEENKNFDKVFVSFIRAGEESGTLDDSLNYLAEWLERSSTLEKEMKAATLYPKIIITFAILVGGGLSVFVLPDLVGVFDGLDVEFPITTTALLFISDLMQEKGLYILAGVVLLLVSVWLLLKVGFVKKMWDGIKLRIPVVSSIVKDYQLTVVSQLVTTLFSSGLTIDESLEIVAESVTNEHYAEALRKIKERIYKGVGFSEAIEEYPNLFSSVFVSVVTTGEETGSYGESFSYLSDFFASRITERIKNLPVALEPILLIFIGILVAFLAHAIILPIYQITQGLM